MRRPAISSADRINIGAYRYNAAIGSGGREVSRGEGTLMRGYDMIMRRRGIMYVGSCMIIWRDKAALSRHKLNRSSPSSLSPPSIVLHPPSPTLVIGRNAHRGEGHTCCTSRCQRAREALLSSYVRAIAYPRSNVKSAPIFSPVVVPCNRAAVLQRNFG